MLKWVLLLAACAFADSGGLGAKEQVISSTVGKYVFSQVIGIGGLPQKYMLDTQTGRLWKIWVAPNKTESFYEVPYSNFVKTKNGSKQTDTSIPQLPDTLSMVFPDSTK